MVALKDFAVTTQDDLLNGMKSDRLHPSITLLPSFWRNDFTHASNRTPDYSFHVQKGARSECILYPSGLRSDT